MPRSSQTRLALASEKPDTCTGPPRLPSPQGARQEARIDIFVPDGYLTLQAAIQRVATIVHGEKFVSLSEQETQDLAFFDRRQG